MKQEINAVLNIVSTMIETSSYKLANYQLVTFRKNLQLILERRFNKHWFPIKDGGYRTLRINEKIDPLLIEAAKKTNILESKWRHMFWLPIIIGVNPGEVYYITEKGKSVIVYQSTK